MFVRVIFCSFFLLCVVPPSSADDTDAGKLYRDIEKIGMKWNDGLFGSTRVYERELSDFLYSVTGREIESPMDFVMLKPYAKGQRTMICDLYYAKWLRIRGVIDSAQIEKLKKERQEKSSDWEQSGIMVRLSGKLRKFTLDRSQDEKRLILFVDGLKLSGLVR
jgi:hypothetical protein